MAQPSASIAPSHPTHTDGGSSRLTAPFDEATLTVDESAVQQLFGPQGGISPQELAGTGFTFRIDWGDRHGSWKLNLDLGSITSRSRVFVAIGEGAAGGPDAGKFIGAAKYHLNNVAPRNGGVDIWVDIDWGSDIRLYADYLVVNP